MREWFRFDAKADDPSAVDIYILDYIGDWLDQEISEFWGIEMGVTAKGFVEKLAALDESVRTIRVHINSPGGDVFAGLTIANALRDQRVTRGRNVETIVDGIAASIASVIAMAGSPARIADNAMLMVHNPWTIAIGDAKDLAKSIASLGTMRDSIIASYQWHSEMSPKEIGALMDAETWMDAEEAIANGFADEKVEGLKAAASIDPRGMAKLVIPEKFSERVKALLKPDEKPADATMTVKVEVDTTAVDAAIAKVEKAQASAQPVIEAAARLEPAEATDVLRLVVEAGLDIAFAQAVLGEELDLEHAQARVGAEKERRASAKARETEIRALCGARHQDDLADEIIASAMPVAAVRDHLAKITAKLDAVQIDSGLAPDHGAQRRPVIDVQAVYAERNGLRLVK